MFYLVLVLIRSLTNLVYKQSWQIKKYMDRKVGPPWIAGTSYLI